MNVPAPHYLLYANADHQSQSGQWRFELRMPDGATEFEATDIEPDARGERLDLLTVVRALEWLDQPSKVTLVGCGPYVRKGLEYGLPEWRDNGWQWEFFGQMVPVKNGDLWQRLDRTLRYHQVECRIHRIDPAHRLPTEHQTATVEQADDNAPATDCRALEKSVVSAKCEEPSGPKVAPHCLNYASQLVSLCRQGWTAIARRIVCAPPWHWKKSVN